jgi:hypothetical protein
MAKSSLVDDDSPFSSSKNLSENENSGSPSTEYEATAKSDASLAITALLSGILHAGIFLSSKAVASIGRIDERANPVCQQRIGQPFHSSANFQTSYNAGKVKSSTRIVLLHGLALFLASSDTLVATRWQLLPV